MQQNTKSATTAGLLGIFLGSFGAHNWYLGEKNKGIAHVCMMSAGLLVQIIAGMVLPSVLSFSAFLRAAAILSILTSVAWAAMSASAVWGLVEGITIITQGDAGLAQKGYPVAAPAMAQNNGQQPMNNGFNGQPMNNNQNMQNNANNTQNNASNNMQNNTNNMQNNANMDNANNNVNNTNDTNNVADNSNGMNNQTNDSIQNNNNVQNDNANNNMPSDNQMNNEPNNSNNELA